jgi:hypothetical protein
MMFPAVLPRCPTLQLRQFFRLKAPSHALIGNNFASVFLFRKN